jgi:hypothetical protein
MTRLTQRRFARRSPEPTCGSCQQRLLLPEFEERREANTAKQQADRRLQQLLAPGSQGGFDLDDDYDLRVTVARRELAERTREAKRIDDLDATRSAAWRQPMGEKP